MCSGCWDGLRGQLVRISGVRRPRQAGRSDSGPPHRRGRDVVRNEISPRRRARALVPTHTSSSRRGRLRSNVRRTVGNGAIYSSRGGAHNDEECNGAKRGYAAAWRPSRRVLRAFVPRRHESFRGRQSSVSAWFLIVVVFGRRNSDIGVGWSCFSHPPLDGCSHFHEDSLVHHKFFVPSFFSFA